MTRLEELERELVTLRASGNGQTHPVVLNALIEAARIVTKIEDRMDAPVEFHRVEASRESIARMKAEGTWREPRPEDEMAQMRFVSGDEGLQSLNDLLQQAKVPPVIENVFGPGGVRMVPVTQGRWDAMVFTAKHRADRIAVLERRLSIMSENLRALWRSTDESLETAE